MSFVSGQDMGVVVWGTLAFGRFRVLVPLLVRVVGDRGWEMLAGKGGWRKVFMDHLECLGNVWIGC